MKARVVVFLSPETVAAIDAYRRRGETIPSRAEAIRQLIEKGRKAIEPDCEGIIEARAVEKACRKEYRKEYRKAYHKAYREAHRESIRAYARAWAKAHLEKRHAWESRGG